MMDFYAHHGPRIMPRWPSISAAYLSLRRRTYRPRKQRHWPIIASCGRLWLMRTQHDRLDAWLKRQLEREGTVDEADPSTYSVMEDPGGWLVAATIMQPRGLSAEFLRRLQKFLSVRYPRWKISIAAELIMRDGRRGRGHFLMDANAIGETCWSEFLANGTRALWLGYQREMRRLCLPYAARHARHRVVAPFRVTAAPLSVRYGRRKFRTLRDYVIQDDQSERIRVYARGRFIFRDLPPDAPRSRAELRVMRAVARRTWRWRREGERLQQAVRDKIRELNLPSPGRLDKEYREIHVGPYSRVHRDVSVHLDNPADLSPWVVAQFRSILRRRFARWRIVFFFHAPAVAYDQQFVTVEITADKTELRCDPIGMRRRFHDAYLWSDRYAMRYRQPWKRNTRREIVLPFWRGRRPPSEHLRKWPEPTFWFWDGMRSWPVPAREFFGNPAQP